ncbi:MAG: hydroxymethylbilane synthase [Planctomycetes bacterium]|nr:hydroxymethylbilane synthase [Planctomycetota bacterium]
MTTLRVGTRGSDLALWQTSWVCERLRQAHPSLQIEQVIIKTHGDAVTDKNFGRDWPVGAFVSAIENALIEKRVDFAVHSFKDLQTAETTGLTIAATPPREVAHDLLLTKTAMRLEDLPAGARIGTNSPRRAAQLLRLGTFEIVPIRGNVPTRIAKIEREGLDAVVLAAAGVKRLGISYPHVIELPTDVMVPAPAQGALAVQTRQDSEAIEYLAVLDHVPTRRVVTAERGFLRRINAGCHTPVGALATVDGERVSLHARLFSDDYAKVVEGRESGTDPTAVGNELADRLLSELKDQP